jgi:hypothetical protein
MQYSVSYVIRNPPGSMWELFRVVTDSFPAAAAVCRRDGFHVKWDIPYFLNAMLLKSKHVQNCNSACLFVWLWDTITFIEGVWKQCDELDIGPTGIISWGLRNLHSEKLHNFQSLPINIRMIKRL